MPAAKHPLRILHLTTRLDGYGGASMLRSLAMSQAAAGDRVVVAPLLAEKLPVHALRDQNVTVQTLGGRWPIDVIALARLARLRRQLAAAVTHTWDVRTLAHAALSGRRRPGQVLIGSLLAIGDATRWSERVLRSVHPRVTALTVPEEASRERLTQLGIDASRIHVIPPGVSRRGAGEAGPARAGLLSELQLAGETKLIAVAGPLRRHRQVDEAIWAFELVRIIHPTARLLIVGDGNDRARLEGFAQQVSEPGCVRFLGYRDDWLALLPGIDVFWQLNASVTTPLAVLEAGAAGVPSVASDVPAHRAAVVHDRTGLLVKLGDRAEAVRATDELFANRARAERMGLAAAERMAEKWSLDATLAAFDRLYERLVHAPAP
ncbi:glycosyltransferase family 4 protein [Lacipirellula limnantheis]|uniref:GDP-mannose-dependent alpha-(1-6)-phosphatidylinositol monomannoside mannosyltransferase n=1 Tax=Lacipirellula limnantheis TaxID=2528024 RepID=A0A517U6N6_9BACT|nr:glycosyltransferase family 4 protein [Lacipirellula limnantheis]QDT76296.1 GDP-mannose-dependent alpha-(1-6)-phosphatidylinositol monomannoside mannosyltransferase [Lacipirellula limnantheis]